MKNRIKRSMAFLLCAVLLTVSLTACGKSGSGSFSGNGVKILMVLHADDDGFLNTLADAIIAKAKEVGATIDIVYSQNSTETQMEQIAGAASGGYDAIICRLCDTSTALQMENAAGDLPVVFINNEPESDYLKGDQFVYVGSYEQDAGAFHYGKASRRTRNPRRLRQVTSVTNTLRKCFIICNKHRIDS